MKDAGCGLKGGQLCPFFVMASNGSRRFAAAGRKVLRPRLAPPISQTRFTRLRMTEIWKQRWRGRMEYPATTQASSFRFPRSHFRVQKIAQPGGVSCVSIDAMTNEGRDDKGGMEARDDEALWALLGRQDPPAQVGPYLSRRVLREIALADDARSAGWWGRVRNAFPHGVFARRGALWSGAFSGGCAVLLLLMGIHAGKRSDGAVPRAGTVLAEQTVAVAPTQAVPPVEVAPVQETTAEDAPAAVSADDVEVIADLDNVLQREENRRWTEDTGRF